MFKISIVGAIFACMALLMQCFSGQYKGLGGGSKSLVKQGSILSLDLKGVIDDNSKKLFLEHLRKYAPKNNIKGVLIRVDSPGGSVSTSQEIYRELKKIKEKLKKPVVISAGSMMASGALYSASSASNIIVNEGTLVGSIGVIFPLKNLEKLYEWAKVEVYSIKTGEFKDSTANYRPMTSKERILFQYLANELLEQFKSAIIEGRKMDPKELAHYADGRIFSGDTAVSAGFADAIGTYSDAIELVGELAGLGKSPKFFKPKPNYSELFFKRLAGSSFNNKNNILSDLSNLVDRKSIVSLFGLPPSFKPLYILPAAIGL